MMERKWHSTKERKLIVSVILRAVKDYLDGFNVSKITRLKSKGLDHELSQLQKNCKSARFWLYEEKDTDYIFSFEKCCEIISVSPERIRRGLRQLIQGRLNLPPEEIKTLTSISHRRNVVSRLK